MFHVNLETFYFPYVVAVVVVVVVAGKSRSFSF